MSYSKYNLIYNYLRLYCIKRNTTIDVQRYIYFVSLPLNPLTYFLILNLIELKDFMNSRKIKFELVKDDEYDPEFVAKVQTSRQQARDGEFVKIDLDNIWK